MKCDCVGGKMRAYLDRCNMIGIQDTVSHFDGHMLKASPVITPCQLDGVLVG